MNIEFSESYADKIDDIVALFGATFAASEGDEEGELIAGLARDLLENTNQADIEVFMACGESALVGCIMFTRLHYAEDERDVVLLAPVAVATHQQRGGIGQALIKHGLAAMRQKGADVAITYGDPAYYGKFGFRQISTRDAAAPMELNYPHGWMAKPLTQDTFEPLRGPSSCVAAFNNPAYW